MDYGEPLREFPSWPRTIAAVASAILLPTMLLVHVLGTVDIKNWSDLREMLFLLGVFVGQSVIIAIPAALGRWSQMSNPLLECVLFGALAAPGPLGYFAIMMLSMMGNAGGVVLFILLAPLGAIGGFAGWAVATNFGRQTSAENQ